MFKIKFGIIWTVFTAIAIFVFLHVPYDTEYIEVNDVLVPTDGSNVLLIPMLGLGIFALVGIYLIISGAREVLNDRKTNVLGKETYALVLDVVANGSYQGNKAGYDAKVILIDDNNQLRSFTETIGFDFAKVAPGEFYKVKYHNDDMNFIDYRAIYIEDDDNKRRLLSKYRDYVNKNANVANTI